MKNIFLNDEINLPGYKLLDYIPLPYQYSGDTIYEVFGTYKHLKTNRVTYYFISFIMEKQGETQTWVVTNKTITNLMDETGRQAPNTDLKQYSSFQSQTKSI